MTVDPSECRCLACLDLVAQERSWLSAARLARKLSSRGWAGTYSPAELQWLRRHVPRWWGDQRYRARRGLQERLQRASSLKEDQLII